MGSPTKNKYKQRVQQQMLTNYYLSKVDRYMSKINQRKIETTFASRQPPSYATNNPKRKNFKELLLQRKGIRNKNYSNQENKQQSMSNGHVKQRSGRKNFKQEIQMKNSLQKNKKQNKKNFHLLENTIVNQLYKPSPSPIESGKFNQIQIVHKVTYFQKIQKQRQRQKIQAFKIVNNQEQDNIQINYHQNLIEQADQSDARQEQEFKIKMQRIQHTKITQAIKQTFQRRSPKANKSRSKQKNKDLSLQKEKQNKNLNQVSKQKQKPIIDKIESPKFNKQAVNINNQSYFKSSQKFPPKYQTGQFNTAQGQAQHVYYEKSNNQSGQNPKYQNEDFQSVNEYSNHHQNPKFGYLSQQVSDNHSKSFESNKNKIYLHYQSQQDERKSTKSKASITKSLQSQTNSPHNPSAFSSKNNVSSYNTNNFSDIKRPPISRKQSIDKQKEKSVTSSQQKNRKQNSLLYQNNAGNMNNDDSFHRNIPEIEQQPKVNINKDKMDLNSSNFDNKSARSKQSNRSSIIRGQSENKDQYDFSMVSKFSMTSQQGNTIKEELQRQINDNQFGPYQNALTNLLQLINQYPNAWPIFVVGQRILEDRRQYQNKRQVQQNQISKLQAGIQHSKKIIKKRQKLQQNNYQIVRLVRQLAKLSQQ